MNGTPRFLLQDLVKQAQANAMDRARIAKEAAAQQKQAAECKCGKDPCECGKKEKDSCGSKMGSAEEVTTDYAMKLASAVEFAIPYIPKLAAPQAPPPHMTETRQEPGKGPNALHVMESAVGGSPPGPGQQGKATPANTPPTHTGTQKSTAAGPSTQIPNTINEPPGGGGTQQTAMPSGKGKTAEAVYNGNLNVLRKLAAEGDWVYGAVPGLFGGGPTGAVMGGYLSDAGGDLAARKGVDHIEGAKRSALGQIAGGLGGGMLGAGVAGAINPNLTALGSLAGGHAGAGLGHHLAMGKYRDMDDKEAGVKQAEGDGPSPALAAGLGGAAGLVGGMLPGGSFLGANPIANAIGAYHGAKDTGSAEGAARGALGAGLGANYGGLAGGLGGGALGAGVGALGGGLLARRLGITPEKAMLGGAAAVGGLGAIAGGLPGAYLGGKKGYHMAVDGATPKEGSAPQTLVDAFLATIKQAEDAINPAQISAGPAVEPDATQSGQGTPPTPNGSQMVGSNESAINYTKQQAKAEPKRDMSAYVSEPALASAHDNTLQQAFSHTGEAGVKMSSAETAAMQVSRARALLENIAAAATK